MENTYRQALLRQIRKWDPNNHLGVDKEDTYFITLASCAQSAVGGSARLGALFLLARHRALTLAVKEADLFAHLASAVLFYLLYTPCKKRNRQRRF